MATRRITRFPDPASAPFGAATATTVVDEETGASGTTFADTTGMWCGCAVGYTEQGSSASSKPPDEDESADGESSAAALPPSPGQGHRRRSDVPGT